MTNSRRRFLTVFTIVFVVILTADLLSKNLIFSFILSEPGRHSVSLINGSLRLTLVKNTGAVWGLFQGEGTALLVINMIFVPLIFLTYLYSVFRGGFLVKRCTYTYTLAMSFILSGAVGNIYDRIQYGYVRDFIDVTIPIIEKKWPVFNLADSAISTGAFLLLLCMFQDYRENEKDREDKDEDEEN